MAYTTTKSFERLNKDKEKCAHQSYFRCNFELALALTTYENCNNRTVYCFHLGLSFVSYSVLLTMFNHTATIFLLLLLLYESYFIFSLSLSFFLTVLFTLVILFGSLLILYRRSKCIERFMFFDCMFMPLVRNGKG